jgi:hypothetical protein
MSSEPIQHAKALAARLAHRALAKLLKHHPALDRPVVGKATDDDSGLQAVLLLAPWDGTPQLNVAAALPGSPPGSPTPAAIPLRGVEAAALRAAPGPPDRPVSVRALARMANYRDTGHWREAVRQLVERGLLVRVRGGVRRTAA